MHQDEGEKPQVAEQKTNSLISELEDPPAILKAIDDDLAKARSLRVKLREIRSEVKRNQLEADASSVTRGQTQQSGGNVNAKGVGSTPSRRKTKRTLQPKSSIFFTPNGHKPRRRPKSTPKIRDIPGFFEHAKSQHQRLVRVEASTGIKLKAIKQQIYQSRVKVLELYEKANSRIGVLRKYQRQLSSFAEDLSRLGRLKTTQADEILSSLTLFDNQRKQLMDEMVDPQWTRPHCFYMFAIEHFRGNKQAHLLELAEAMPGNLAITAVANRSVQQHKEKFQKYEELTADRSLLEEKLGVVTKRREICRAHLKDYKKMLIVMKNKMSSAERDKIRKAEKKMSVGQPLIVQAPRRTPRTLPRGMSSRRKPDDFRRSLLRAAGVVDQPKKDVQTTWQNRNVKEYVLQVDRFLTEAPSDDFVHSTTLRRLDLNATTRRLFAMPIPPPNPATGSPCTSPKACSPSNSPRITIIPDDNKSPSLEPSNLLPSPIPLQSTSVPPCLTPPALLLSPSRGYEVDPSPSPVGFEGYNQNKTQERNAFQFNTPLYNRDWSVLADILKNISNANKDHVACKAQLNKIREKSKQFQVAVEKLEIDWRTTVKADPLVTPATSSVSQFFNSASLVNTEKLSEEQEDSLSKSVESIDVDEVTLIARPDDEPVII